MFPPIEEGAGAALGVICGVWLPHGSKCILLAWLMVGQLATRDADHFRWTLVLVPHWSLVALDLQEGSIGVPVAIFAYRYWPRHTSIRS